MIDSDMLAPPAPNRNAASRTSGSGNTSEIAGKADIGQNWYMWLPKTHTPTMTVTAARTSASTTRRGEICRTPRCSELSSITAGGISVRAVRAFAGTRVAQMLQYCWPVRAETMPASRKEETMGATSTTPMMNAPIRRIVSKRPG